MFKAPETILYDHPNLWLGTCTHDEHQIAFRVVNYNKSQGPETTAVVYCCFFSAKLQGLFPMCAYLYEPQWLLILSVLHRV